MRTAIPAAVFVVVVVVATALAGALGLKVEPGSGADTAFLVGIILLYAGTGFAIGHWRSIALVLLTVLVALPFGDPDDDDVAVWMYVAIDTVFFFGPVMLAGIALRKLAWFWVRRRRSTQSAASN